MRRQARRDCRSLQRRKSLEPCQPLDFGDNRFLGDHLLKHSIMQAGAFAYSAPDRVTQASVGKQQLDEAPFRHLVCVISMD